MLYSPAEQKYGCVISDLAKSPIPSREYCLMFIMEFEEIY